MPRTPVRVLSAIQTGVIVVSFIGFLWCLWKLPQEHNAYPDGFLQCPDLSYKVQNARNVTIKCTSCPDCPPGQEPTPPCGSNISKETASECSICRPKTYSEEHGSGTCKPCPNCGLRETINPCTSERGTQCGDCPRRHYQADLAINSCKECSKCCGGRSYAELECIYLKQCRRKNCTQQTEIKKNRVLKLEGTNKIFPTLVRAAYHMRIAASEGLMSRVNKNTRFKREVNTTLQKPNYLIDPDDTVVVNSTKFQAEDSNPSTTLIAERSATTSKLEKASFGTTSESNVMEPTVVPSSSYFGDGDVKKLLKILIGLACFGVLLLLFIATVVTCICWKRIQSQQMQGSAYTITCCARYIGEGYLPVLHSDYSTPQSDHEFHETSHSSSNTATSAVSEEITDIHYLESLPLSEMPLDLTDSLEIKLDARRKGRSLGWQKVADKFKLGEHVLQALHIEYESKAGRPTKQLMEILTTRGKTVAELVNALKSPEVNYPDVALLIQQRMGPQTH